MKASMVWALAVLLCGLLHSANAMYRFHMKLPDLCDLRVNITINGGAMHPVTSLQYRHGSFEFIENTMHVGEQKYVTYQLQRPDYAMPGSVAREFISNGNNCHEQDIKSGPTNPFADVWFVSKEPAEYHGIACTALYNDTSMTYFVNEDVGKIYGIVSGEQDISIDIQAEKNNTPSTFTYSMEKQPGCHTRTFIKPTPSAYNGACKKHFALPDFLASVLRLAAAH